MLLHEVFGKITGTRLERLALASAVTAIGTFLHWDGSYRVSRDLFSAFTPDLSFNVMVGLQPISEESGVDESWGGGVRAGTNWLHSGLCDSLPLDKSPNAFGHGTLFQVGWARVGCSHLSPY